MPHLLMVPVKLDALLLERDQVVVSASADFSALPYSDGTRDVNAGTANVSENILSKPFENLTLHLESGVHLHWSLPDALTRGAHSREGTVFPAVPNRWLVVRSIRELSGPPIFDAAWVVESDFLVPDGAPNLQGSVSIPRPDAAAGKPPFRYLGRQVPLADWRPHDAQAEYLPRLTAVGHGDPTFAALYGSCRSVFGFFDEKPGFQYDLVGWYSNPAADPLAARVAGLSGEAAQAAILEAFDWEVFIPDGEPAPQGMLCYARLTFELSGSIDNPALADTTTEITIAHTGTEALSAWLARQIAPSRKAAIEDKLEAVQLASRLQSRQLDLGARFKEARHEKGFVGMPGGTLWTVRPVRTGAPAGSADAQQQVALPDALALALDALNQVQSRYDRAHQEIVSLRRQLFADWYKFMLCADPPDDARDDYPLVDLVRFFVEQRGLLPLQARLAATGSLSVQKNASGGVSGAAGSSGTLAAEVAQAIRDLLEALPEPGAGGAAWSLRPAPAPRYWLPREPVVLLTGPAVLPTDRHGRDSRLACNLLSGTGNVADLLPAGVGTLTGRITAIGTGPGIDVWTVQPWNPILLEWEVEVLPLARGSNHDPAVDRYDPGFIEGCFSLPLDRPDLALRPGRGALRRRACIYSGTSILTPHAPHLVARHLREFLEKAGPSPDADLQAARVQLEVPSLHCLSQSLGGFNEALLMRQQVLQLPIADPLGFADDRSFSQAVGAAVGSQAVSAPQPLWDFNPIRTGALRLLQLRLVDTFGQVKDLDGHEILTPEALKMPGDATLVALPPRLAQPARIGFRWLAAGTGEQEMNDHPATTPVCGWLLPNNLDGSLMIYDNQGRAQGILDLEGTWRGLADQAAVPIASIANPHLRRLAVYLKGQPRTFREAFLAAIGSSLENIDPENAAQHLDLALLLGRPVALARAALDLELQGLPAVHQGWSAFRQDLERDGRDHDGFPDVRFPIRLGEYGQLNDGLVGYWQEEQDGSYAGGIFHAPQSDPVGDGQILTHGENPAPIFQTLGGPPLVVSLLVDPRGAVHATSGILPAKAISIPADHYAEALRAIEVAFLTAPILTSAGSLDLPLPAAAGFGWSWLPRRPDEAGTIGRARPEAVFSTQEIREGWLKLTPQD